MKKIQKSTFLLITALLINVVAYAQVDIDPADLGGSGSTNPLDEADAPIDENLWILLIIGFVYIFFKIKTYSEKAKIQ